MDRRRRPALGAELEDPEVPAHHRHGDVVDRRPADRPLADDVLERAETLRTKVMSLTERSADYGTLLEMARALREQIDWQAVRTRSGEGRS
jgi:hypothetical protein